MIDIFAYIAGIFAMISFIPQMVKSIKTKSTGDISWLMLITTLISVAAYEIYAWYLWLLPVVIMNGIFFVSVLVTTAIKLHYDSAAKHA